MRPTFKALLLSSVALCATASFAGTLARVNVPFSFTAKGQSYPAGTYNILTNSQSTSVTLQNNADAGKHIMWVVGPAERAKTAAVVSFDQTGSDHALKTIQIGDKITPNLNTPAKPGIGATVSIGGQ